MRGMTAQLGFVQKHGQANTPLRHPEVSQRDISGVYQMKVFRSEPSGYLNKFKKVFTNSNLTQAWRQTYCRPHRVGSAGER